MCIEVMSHDRAELKKEDHPYIEAKCQESIA